MPRRWSKILSKHFEDARYNSSIWPKLAALLCWMLIICLILCYAALGLDSWLENFWAEGGASEKIGAASNGRSRPAASLQIETYLAIGARILPHILIITAAAGIFANAHKQPAHSQQFLKNQLGDRNYISTATISNSKRFFLLLNRISAST